MKRYPFWTDGLDVELLDVVPGVEEALGDDADVRLYTHCNSPTHGRLNHPVTQNCDGGFVAYVGVSPALVSVPGWVGRARIIECTFAELWRDVWWHDCGVVLQCGLGGRGFKLLRPGHVHRQFDALMWHVRGWRTLAPRELWWARSSTLRAIRTSRRKLDLALRMAGMR